MQPFTEGVLVGCGEGRVDTAGQFHGISRATNVFDHGLDAGRSKWATKDLAKVAQNGVGLRELGLVIGADAEGGLAKGVCEGLNMILPVESVGWEGCEILGKRGGLALMNTLGVERLDEAVLWAEVNGDGNGVFC